MTITTSSTNTTLNYPMEFESPSEATIKENARYITEFMEIKVKFIDFSHVFGQRSFWMIDHDSKPVDNRYFDCPVSFTSEEDCLESFIHSSRYHESFDWLMTVVDKIESMPPLPIWPHSKFRVLIKNNVCQIDVGENTIGVDGTFFVSGTNKLIATYHAVKIFINWYNKVVTGWIGIS